VGVGFEVAAVRRGQRNADHGVIENGAQMPAAVFQPALDFNAFGELLPQAVFEDQAVGNGRTKQGKQNSRRDIKPGK
jgi:hypothetical protein